MSNCKTVRPFLSLGGLLLWLPVLVFGFPSVANSQGTSVVAIRRVDASQFPLMKAYVSVVNGDGSAVKGLGAPAFAIREDNTALNVDSLTTTAAGMALAFVIDASGSFSVPGNPRACAPSATRLDEAKRSIDELILPNKGRLPAAGPDQVAVFVPDPSRGGKAKLLTGPTNDLVRVHNELYPYTVPQNVVNTPLRSILFDAVNALKDQKFAAQAKAIVIFSDGIDVLSEVRAEDIGGIPVHTVFMGGNSADDRNNLARLSTITNGVFVSYECPDGPATLSPILERMLGLRDQYVVTYRSAVHSGGNHTLVLGARVGNQVVEASPQPFGIKIDPPQVEIVSPATGTRIVRSGATYDVKTEELTPKNSDIRIKVSWPDGHPRNLKEVIPVVDGRPRQTITKAPFEDMSVDISGLGDGTHFLQVQVKDEYDLLAQSDALPFTVRVDLPVKPTPPAPSAWEQLLETLSKVGWLGSLAVALLALGLVIILFVRPVREGVIEHTTSTLTGMRESVKTITERWFPDTQSQAEPGEAEAYLVVMNGGEKGRRVELTQENLYLGREPRLVDVPLSDKTISRKHARIVEEQDGVYRIYDEGSTSGTYVNRKPVLMAGQELKNKDVINLGRVQLEFRLSEKQGADVTEQYGQDGGERTQKFQFTAVDGEETEYLKPDRSRTTDDNDYTTETYTGSENHHEDEEPDDTQTFTGGNP